MWKYKLGLIFTTSFLAFFLWLTFPSTSEETKTVTYIIIMKHDGNFIEHYMYKQNTTCDEINKELTAYRLYGLKHGYFADYFFHCKPYVMIQ